MMSIEDKVQTSYAPMSARRAKTQAKLIDAARYLFTTKGVGATSVEEISEQAGFTRGAFYSNFADKEEILVRVSQLEFGLLGDRVLEQFENLRQKMLMSQDGRSELARLTDFISEIVSLVPVDREFYLIQSELALYTVRYPGSKKRLLAPRLEFISRMDKTLEDALAQAGVNLTVSAEAVLQIIIGLRRQAIENELLLGSDPVLSDLPGQGKILIDALVAGLAKL